MSAKVVDDGVKVGCALHQAVQVHDVQRHGGAGFGWTWARGRLFNVEQRTDDIFDFEGERVPVPVQHQIAGLDAAHEFAVPVPEGLAGLVVGAGGGDESVPDVFGMVEQLQEGLLPQQLVGGVDEVACTSAGGAEGGEVARAEIGQDELQELGGKLDEGSGGAEERHGGWSVVSKDTR